MDRKINRKTRFTGWLAGVVILALAECTCVAAIQVAITDVAQAQSRQRRGGGGFFEQLFGISPQQRYDERGRDRGRDREPAPTDYSRAPSPRKPDSKAEPAAPTTTTIMVMGDGMADWLAYGLEDAFSDSPDIAIIRQSKAHSGLLHYDSKGDLDWPRAARDFLATDKPNYVVMMVGISDRQSIREKDFAKDAVKQPDKPGTNRDQVQKDGEDAVPDAIIAPEPPPSKKANSVFEFRTDQWEKLYSRRIDETVAALKSSGAPVFWVGLPSIRGTRSTADAVYLNELYRARAERAGAVYIDVWDGFVDDEGKYTTYGPDYEGQVRRLRSGDGVYFTKYGARKLAHYVEREIRRYMSNRGPIALPSGPMGPVPADGAVARPLAGPVVPLTMATGSNDESLAGGGTAQVRDDAFAAKVLVKGDPVTAPIGRADDFVWPQGGDAKAAVDKATANKAATAPNAPAPAAPVKLPPEKSVPGNSTSVQATPGKSAAVAKPTEAPAVAPIVAPVLATPESIIAPEPGVAKPEPAAKLEPEATPETKPEAKPEANPVRSAVAKPKAAEDKPRRQHESAPRPARRASDGLFGPSGPFGWMR